jgi:hypothetical protein
MNVSQQSDLEFMMHLEQEDPRRWADLLRNMRQAAHRQARGRPRKYRTERERRHANARYQRKFRELAQSKKNPLVVY